MKVTIKDIATEAGISYSSVSRALNGLKGVSEETRVKVMKIAEEMHYTPNAVARGLVQQQTATLGLILPDITNPFYPELARGVEEEASRRGFSTFLCNTNYDPDKEESYVTNLMEKRVDGIILCPISSRSYYQELRKRMPVPFIFLGNAPENTRFSYVVVDNIRGGYLAARTLIEKGYRDIGFISGSDGESVVDERITGFRDAMNRYGLPINEDFIVRRDWRKSSGYETACEWIDSGRFPQAIIGGSDLIALGIIQGIKEKGLKIPEDIAVMGFDDIPNAAWPEINLTTIRQPKIKMGEAAVGLLIDLIEEEDLEDSRDNENHPLKKIILDPELVLRGTC